MSDFPDLDKRMSYTQASANMLATCNAALQDLNSCFAMVLTAVSLCGSTLLLATSMADDKLLALLPVFASTPEAQLAARIKVYMASFAAVTFFATLLDLAFRPGARAETHKRAVDHYVQAKSKIRSLREFQKVEELTNVEVLRKFEVIEQDYLNREGIPSIPEILYLPLKCWHEFKFWCGDLITWLFSLVSPLQKRDKPEIPPKTSN